MKIKKMIAACIAVVILFASTGCQLAREDAGEANNGERLIGVFATKEYLDLFDMEGYIKDNINKMSVGGKITVDGNSSKYQGRLYATLATQTLTDEETGRTFDTKEFVFDSVKGIAYFSAEVPATEDENSFITSGSDEAISEGHASLHYGDNEDKTTLEGTIYMPPGQAGSICYINPVYQSADGSVYAIAGSGFSIGGIMSEGSVYSQKLEETTTITQNGKSKLTSISIKISIATMYPPEQVVVLQMDKKSTILMRAEYTPGELPKMLIPEESTEFIIVETYKHDQEGNSIVSRTLYDKSKQAMETFYRRDDGICVKQWTQIAWNKNP